MYLHLPNKHITILTGSFSVPSTCVELRGDVGEKEKPLVNLLLEELKATYESCEPYKTITEVGARNFSSFFIYALFHFRY